MRCARTVTMLVLTLGAGVLSVVPATAAVAAPVAASNPVVVVADEPATKAAPRKAWRPPSGAAFNDPTGGPKARAAVVSRLRSAIRHTPRGATIRISTFNFDRGDVAELLIRAHRRGVHVQVVAMDHTAKSKVLPDHTDDAGDPEAEAPDIKPKPNSAQGKLVKELGKNRSKPSFIVFCKGSCRNGGGGNLHTKVYSFSKTGAARYVVMTTSGNLTWGSAFAQWNDSYTIVGDRQLFRTWVSVFRQLKNDRKSTPRRVNYTSSERSLAFQRQAQASAKGTTTVGAARAGSKDPVIQRLSKIGCTAPTGSGSAGHTVIRIIMYGWYGNRGDSIARKVAFLKSRGCEVKVIGSVLGPSTASILRRAGIAMKAADWDFGDRISTDGQKIVTGPRCYSHYKVLAVNGRYDGKARQIAWTGSENWSGISFGNDELTIRLNGRAVYKRYYNLFRKMWNDPDATHAVGVKPTRRPCANG